LKSSHLPKSVNANHLLHGITMETSTVDDNLDLHLTFGGD
jgi:hypothetical protein